MASLRTKFYLDKQNAQMAGRLRRDRRLYRRRRYRRPHRLRARHVARLSGTPAARLLDHRLDGAEKAAASSTTSDPDQKKFWQGVRANPRSTARDVRSRFRDIDRRLADVETYVTSSNNRLAREIEQLR